jgi:hypothetical protein
MWNEEPKPFVWTKTADEILDSGRASVELRTGPVTTDNGDHR